MSKRKNEIIINQRWSIYRDPFSWVTVQKIRRKNKKTGKIYFEDKNNYHGNLRNAIKFILEVDPSMSGEPEITDLWSVVERQKVLFIKIQEIFSKEFENFLKEKENDN